MGFTHEYKIIAKRKDNGVIIEYKGKRLTLKGITQINKDDSVINYLTQDIKEFMNHDKKRIRLELKILERE